MLRSFTRWQGLGLAGTGFAAGVLLRDLADAEWQWCIVDAAAALVALLAVRLARPSVGRRW